METSHCGESYLPLALEGPLGTELYGPLFSGRTFGVWVLWPAACQSQFGSPENA
jgi:hypothetical protein